MSFSTSSIVGDLAISWVERDKLIMMRNSVTQNSLAQNRFCILSTLSHKRWTVNVFLKTKSTACLMLVFFWRTLTPSRLWPHVAPNGWISTYYTELYKIRLKSSEKLIVLNITTRLIKHINKIFTILEYWRISVNVQYDIITHVIEQLCCFEEDIFNWWDQMILIKLLALRKSFVQDLGLGKFIYIQLDTSGGLCLNMDTSFQVLWKVWNFVISSASRNYVTFSQGFTSI